MKLLIQYLVGVIIIILVTGCNYIGGNPNTPRPNTNIPLYPNAHNLTIRNLPPKGSSTKETTFQTTDSREQILAFYKNFFLNNAWEIQESGKPIPNELYFVGGLRTMSTIYTVKLTITPGELNNTVVLTLHQQEPE